MIKWLKKKIKQAKEEQKQKTLTMNASLKQLMIPLMIFSVVSMFSTGAGFYTLITAEGGLGDSVFAGVLSFLITLSLQIGIFFFVTHLVPNIRLFSIRGISGWILMLAAYAIFEFLSILFAISFYFGIMGSQTYADDLVENQYRYVENYVVGIETKFTEIAVALDDLSKKSDQYMDIERNHGGGTCPGGVKAKGTGPAYYTRAFQKAEFNALRDMAKSKLAVLRTTIADIETLTGSSGESFQFDDVLTDTEANKRTNLNSKAITLKALSKHFTAFKAAYQSALTDINFKQKLQLHLDAQFTGYPDTQEFRSRKIAGFACRDSNVSSSIERILDINLPPVSDVDIKVYNPNRNIETIKLISLELWKLIKGVLPYNEKSEKVTTSAFSVEYVMPIFFGVIFDISVLILGLLVSFKDNEVRNQGDLNEFANLYRRFLGLGIKHPILHKIDDFKNGKNNNVDMVGYASAYIKWVVGIVAVQGIEKHTDYIFLPALPEETNTVINKATEAVEFTKLVDDVCEILQEFDLLVYQERLHIDEELSGNKFFVSKISEKLEKILGEFDKTIEFDKHEQAIRWFNVLGFRNRDFDDIYISIFIYDERRVWEYVLEKSMMKGEIRKFTIHENNDADIFVLEKIKTNPELSSSVEEKGIFNIGFLCIHFPVRSIVISKQGVEYLQSAQLSTPDNHQLNNKKA